MINGPVITVNTPGTLSQLLADYELSTITELVVIGSLNNDDITILNSLPNLEVLDMENTNTTELPDYAFYNNKSLRSIRLPRLLKKLGAHSFAKCTNLVNVDILSNIISYGERVFEDCKNLQSTIIISDSVVSIGFYAFHNACSGEVIINCDIPSVDSDSSAWLYGSYFTKITIGDNVTVLGKYAVCNCFYLENLIIGSNVKSIGDYAISNYAKSINIYCKAQIPPKISTSTFSRWEYCTLYVPIECKEAYATANNWKNAKEIIETDFSELN